MSILSKLCVIGFVTASALASTATFLSAQDLRLRLVDEEMRQPLGGLLVSTISTSGASGPAVLTSADGIAIMRMTGAGPYRLLIRRIGFAPFTTTPLSTPSESGTTLDIIVPLHRITLGTVHVVGNQTCSEQTESPSAGAQPAWTEVRTALEASALTRDQRLVTTAALRFQRELRRDGTVDFADTTLRGRSGERPFFAPAPAVLERDGYFKHHDDGSEDFYAPDEAVLLSGGFTRRHCVSVLPDVRHDSAGTQIALAFVPRDRDTRPEIRGLIWLDSATSELRRIDFEYVRISLRAPADSIGGSVAFAHLASGAWIVSAWTLRMPHFRVVDRRANYTVLDGYIEVGGSAWVVRDVATPGPTVTRRIVGSVYDSLAHRPLSGAHVHLSDLGRDAVADSLGTFRFDSVGASVHTLWADHPTLDALGLFSLGARVDVTPQVVSYVTLAIPSFETLWHRACGSAAVTGEREGFVFGSIHAGSVAAPRSATVINITWRADTVRGARVPAMTVKGDSTGNYVACGVPIAQTLAISAIQGAIATPRESFRIGAARIARRDLTFSPTSTIAEGVVDTSNGVTNGTAHTLRVVSTEGRPVVYANVSVDGGTTLITDQKGEIGLGAGKLQALSMSVKRIGFTPWFGKIDFPDTSSVLTVTLAHAAQQLSEVRVTGEKNPSSPFVQGFYDRWMMRQKGALSATFIGPEELEFRHPNNITNMLSGLNGVRLRPIFGLGDNYLVAWSTDASCQMAIVVDGMQQYPQLVPNTGPGSRPYTPAIYAVYINQLLAANDVTAIEVYARGGNMPISLQVNDTRCGVIAFWTGSRR